MTLNILFMGTPQFAKEFLEHFVKNKEFKVSAVYTRPPKKSHRGKKINLSAVHEFAEKSNIPVFTPEKFSEKDILNIKKINPEVIFVAAYGIILPLKILNIPSCGAVNLHASLLPKWRGAAPIHRSIMNGDSKTGISIMKIEEGLDSGPTYLKTEIPIDINDTHEDVYKNLVYAGKISVDNYFLGNKRLFPVPQNHNLATYAKKIQKKEMQINFDNDAFSEHKKICAFSPNPGAWFEINSIKYKVYDTEFLSKEKIKQVEKSKNTILKFKTGYLIIKKIQKEGRNIMSVNEFIRGYPKEFEKIKKKYVF